MGIAKKNPHPQKPRAGHPACSRVVESAPEVTAMALDYGDVSRFVRRNDRVDIKPGKGAKVTILKNGELDAHALIEAKATRFVYKGKEYSAEAFEKLVRDDEAED